MAPSPDRAIPGPTLLGVGALFLLAFLAPDHRRHAAAPRRDGPDGSRLRPPGPGAEAVHPDGSDVGPRRAAGAARGRRPRLDDPLASPSGLGPDPAARDGRSRDRPARSEVGDRSAPAQSAPLGFPERARLEPRRAGRAPRLHGRPDPTGAEMATPRRGGRRRDRQRRRVQSDVPGRPLALGHPRRRDGRARLRSDPHLAHRDGPRAPARPGPRVAGPVAPTGSGSRRPSP